jgi:hypothetical protein
MDITCTEELLEQRETLRISEHALREAHKEGLRIKEVLHAIFNGVIVEQYPERKRVLIAGPVPGEPLPVHVVCDYSDREELVAVTVYIPNRPRWITGQVRGLISDAMSMS